jgi:hypothetical protein
MDGIGRLEAEKSAMLMNVDIQTRMRWHHATLITQQCAHNGRLADWIMRNESWIEIIGVGHLV